MPLRTPAWVPATLLAFALVPLGSAPTRAEYALVIATAVTFLVIVFRGAGQLGFQAYGRTLIRGVSLPLLLALPLLVFVQTLAAIFTDYSAGAPSEILRAGLGLYAIALFYVLVHDAIHDHASFKTVVVSVALVAALEAAYGVFNLLSGNERLLLYPRWAYHDSATGTLVNRNHFALLMALAFPVTVINTRLDRPTWHAGGHRRSEELARRMLLTLASVLVGLGLVFSRSRMGVISFVVACVTVPAFAHLLRTQSPAVTETRRGGWGIPLLSAVLVTLYVLVIGVTPAFERFANLWTDLENGRLPIWRAAIAMAFDHPVIGHGWGSFDFLVDGYRANPTGLDTSYAHNDYLQVFAETGIVGLSFVVCLLILLGRRMVRAFSSSMIPEARFTLLWLGIGIVAALVHSLADFGLRIPGVGFMFTLLLAMFLRISDEPTLVAGRRHRRRSRRPSRDEPE
jgi:O-antigen ligase